MKTEQEFRVRATIGQAWFGIAVLSLFSTGVAELMLGAIHTDFSEFVYHPGQNGFNILCIVVCLGVCMAMLVRLLDQRWFRWLNVALIACITLLGTYHFIAHLMQGKVYGVLSVIEIALSAIGVLGLALSIRWATTRPAAVTELRS